MNKRQFYPLFKSAWARALTPANIASGWRNTGLIPFDPSLILNQLSTRRSPPGSRPNTGHSSTSSAISLSDWKKLTQVVRSAVGDVLTAEARQIVKPCHQLQAENAILKSEIVGLKEAVRVKEKQKKPSKPLFKDLRAEESRDVTGEFVACWLRCAS